MIGNAETGHNRTSSIVLGFKEALLEEAEKKKEKQRLHFRFLSFFNVARVLDVFFSFFISLSHKVREARVV